MWPLFKALIKEELRRLWRRVLRRPDPPPGYAQFRVERPTTPPTPGDGTSAPS
jgi:hypothetical protein